MPSADFQRTIAWLYALEAAKGMDFKLDRVALALEWLGNPQRQFPSIHVAGTNGKGSVAAMLHAVTSAAGYHVGLYTSPHLVRFSERIRVGNAEVAEEDVVALASETRRATAGRIELTFFELVTVMAFLHFARCQVDLAVIEVGLGGRLDATNVIDPLVSVITTIGLDHTEFLGNTIAAVAAEKAGIIKPGRPVILGRVPTEADEVIRRIAAERGAPVFGLDHDFRIEAGDQRGCTFHAGAVAYTELRPGLKGAYQIENMATALAALTQLPPTIAVTDQAVRSGLAAVRWPGRFEQVESDPLVILDGAHNLEGTRALVRELAVITRERKVHVLFAVMRDKPWSEMIDQLGPWCTDAVVTEVLQPRGAPASEVAAVWARYCPTSVVADAQAAWAQVRSCAKRGDAVVVTGSLFLIGAIYPLCRGGWDVGERHEVGSGVP